VNGDYRGALIPPDPIATNLAAVLDRE